MCSYSHCIGKVQWRRRCAKRAQFANNTEVRWVSRKKLFGILSKESRLKMKTGHVRAEILAIRSATLSKNVTQMLQRSASPGVAYLNIRSRFIT